MRQFRYNKSTVKAFQDSWIHDKQMMSFFALLSHLFVSLVQRDEIALMVLNFFVDYRIDSKGWTSAATTLNGSLKETSSVSSPIGMLSKK
ncbi:hypothetical protein COP2_010864 [Malus domestica]